MHILNVNHEHQRQLTKLDKAADASASFVGSWTFIILLVIIVAFWVFINIVSWFYHFDPYPFQFFNLVLAIFSPLSAALILMSQNRQAQKDHIAQDHEYDLNVQNEKDITELKLALEAVRSQQVLLIKDTRKQQTELSDELSDKLDIVILALTKIEERIYKNERKEQHESH